MAGKRRDHGHAPSTDQIIVSLLAQAKMIADQWHAMYPLTEADRKNLESARQLLNIVLDGEQ